MGVDNFVVFWQHIGDSVVGNVTHKLCGSDFLDGGNQIDGFTVFFGVVIFGEVAEFSLTFTLDPDLGFELNLSDIFIW